MNKPIWVERFKHVFYEVIVISVAASFVILGLRAFERYQSPQIPSVPRLQVLTVGSQLKIAAADFTRSPLSLVLISSPTCMYCLASKAFHSKLVAETQRNQVQFFVAVPSRSDAKQYVSDLGFAQSSVREWKDLNLRADATPTILAVDNSGMIKVVWVGVLPPFDESELLNAVESRSFPASTEGSIGLTGTTNYSSKDIERLKSGKKVSIVDIHERGYPGVRPDAVTIPLIEVRYRAPVELDKSDLQLVDCSNLSLAECTSAVRRLTGVGFQVATLNAGLYRQSCKATTVN
jgi:hypothetical protein